MSSLPRAAAALFLLGCGTRTGLELATPSDAAPADGADAMSPAQDGAPSRDSGPDAACTPLELPPPRPLAPLSTARATTRRPRLLWTPSASIPHAVRVELSRTRDFAAVTRTVEGTSNQAETPLLEPGVWFWRLRPVHCGRAGSTTSPVWQLTVGPRDAPRATWWGTTPDFDGDGRADLAVSAYDRAAVFVFSGRSDRSLGAPRAVRGVAGSSFGWSIASAGDTNGDGFADLAVATIRGATTVHHGGPSGPSPSPSATIAPLPGASGFSYVVSSAGDTNGDGFGDLVLGTQAGFALVVPGSPTGARADLAVRLDAPSGTRDFGTAVSQAGDVNGDGYGDVVVGTQTGDRVYLFIGSALGIERDPTSVLPAPRPGVGFGYSVSLAGDVNGDGFADVAVDEGAGSQGGYVFLGSSSGLVARGLPVANLRRTSGFVSSISGGGDLDGDGVTEVLSSFGPSVSGSTARVTFGALVGSPSRIADLSGLAAVGGYTVSSLGDFDGDGFDDVASQSGQGQQVLLHFGSASGPLPRPGAVLAPLEGSTEFALSLAGVGR